MDIIDIFKDYSPCFVIEIYDNGNRYNCFSGNKEVVPKVEKVKRDTIFDIASLTKLFTSCLIYIAYEEKKLNLNDIVYDLDNNFINLKDIKIIDLLTHNQSIWTDGYLGDVTSAEEFYRVLYTAYVKESTPRYMDVHYMILSTLLEKIYNKSYKELCTEKIFNKLNLKHTTFDPVPELCASNNYDYTNGVVIDNVYPGLTHDTKGRVAKSFGIYLGHASIFSTGEDLLKFFYSFFDYSLLKKETIDFMLQHKNTNEDNYNKLKSIYGGTDINEMYDKFIKDNPEGFIPKTYNNMGAYYRNIIDRLNDVPTNSSDRTIAFSGYTGPMFIMDFEKQIIIVVMCNEVHNTHFTRKERRIKELKITNWIYDNLKQIERH